MAGVCLLELFNVEVVLRPYASLPFSQRVLEPGANICELGGLGMRLCVHFQAVDRSLSNLRKYCFLCASNSPVGRLQF